MDQTDPWQVVPIQVFTPYSSLLISTAFVVVSHVGCLGVIGVFAVYGTTSAPDNFRRIKLIRGKLFPDRYVLPVTAYRFQ